MHLSITGQNIDVTESLNDYLKQKMTKITHHCDDIINIAVVFSVVKNTQVVESTIHLSGVDIFAKVETNDMYASIDGLIKKLDTQILKHKAKQQKHRG